MSNSGFSDSNDKQSLIEQLLFPIRRINVKRLAAAINGKTILITGATAGIGEALTLLLSDYNTTLILTGRNEEKLKLFQAQLKNKSCTVLSFTADLREETQIENLLQQLNNKNIEVDIFINNAGKSIYRGLAETLNRYHDIKRSTATNFTGPVQLLLGLLPSILRKQGQLINVSTLTVLLPHTHGWSAYYASKAAFDDWLKCMEPELKANKVSVSSIYLPLVKTDMSMINKNNHKKAAMTKKKAVSILVNYLIARKRKYRPWWTAFVLFPQFVLPNLWYAMQVRKLKRTNK
jgi:short-subunit dehydrogenase